LVSVILAGDLKTANLFLQCSSTGGQRRSTGRVKEFCPETQRQATQHDCLPRLLGNGNYNKVKKCAMKKIIFCTRLTRTAKAGQKSIIPARQAQRTTKEGSLSFVLQESPFGSVSTVSSDHTSLVSLVLPMLAEREVARRVSDIRRGKMPQHRTVVRSVMSLKLAPNTLIILRKNCILHSVY
jgi:hypothetical protein